MQMTMEEYQKRAQETMIYPGRGAFMGLMYTTLKLNGEAGEIADKVGKVLRDDGGYLRPEVREALALELGDVLWYISALANELGSSLESIASENLAKLARRQAKGTLGGSGDDR